MEKIAIVIPLRNAQTTIQKTLESLIKAGAFDFLGNRASLLISMPDIVAKANELKKQSLPNYFWENAEIPEAKNEELKLSTLEEVEREHIKRIIDYTNNNRTKASEILGISRVNLIAKIKKYGI